MAEPNENPKKDEHAENAGGKEPGSKPEVSSGEGTAEVSKDARVFGMLCHLLGILTWIVGPLIIWLIKREDDKFIDQHGKEALNFQITILIAYAVGGITAFACIGFFIMLAAWICNLVFCIMGAIKANNGEPYRYPVSIRLIK